MILVDFRELPSDFQNEKVKYYYSILKKKRASAIAKRLFDIIFSFMMLFILMPVFLIVALLVKSTSNGAIFYCQERVTKYGRIFRIVKFRTMVVGADKKGGLVTVNGDTRVTSIGHFLRKTRLDEIPQLINIIMGDMSFVGTRPEVPKYVTSYSNEMKATLLMPAGVTSLASIKYKDESRLLANANDADKVYIEQILVSKMKYNLEYIEKFNVIYDIKIILQTVISILKNS